MSDFDKLFTALERLCGQHVECMHDEATKYAFKVARVGFRKAGEWHTIDREFLREMAGV